MTKIKKSTYVQASVVVPDFDARYSKIWGSLRVPDDEVKLDWRVKWTRPHVTLFGGLSIHNNKIENIFVHEDSEIKLQT